MKDVSEWGVPEWRSSLQGKEFTDDDDGARRVITDVAFSHEDDARYAKRIIKGEKDIKIRRRSVVTYVSLQSLHRAHCASLLSSKSTTA